MSRALKRIIIFAVNFPANHLSEKVYVRYIMLLSRVCGFIKPPYLSAYSSFYLREAPNVILHKVNYGKTTITFQSGFRINRFLKGFNNAGKALWHRYRIEELTSGELPSAILDVGANIGEFSLYANEKFRGAVKILAIEPDPVARACLRKNLGTSEVLTEEVGVSSDSSIKEFFLKTSSADSSLHAPIGNSTKTHIQLKRLDQLIADHSLVGPILIKMDTEGHEPEALLGASGAIKHIKWISVDTGPERSGRRTTEQVIKVLSEYGFDQIQVFNSDILTAKRR
jgi:FkbM family methyltransferase